MKLKNKNVLVFGLGKSGLAAANLLHLKGANVLVYDDDKTALQALKNNNFLTGDYDIVFNLNEEVFKYLDLIVLNPSVSIFNEHIKFAKLKGIPVISELELGFQNQHSDIIAITGTNGKTTTVKLIENIFKAASKSCLAVGNVGVAFSGEVLEKRKPKTFIVEVSSFQLEAIKNFRPKIAGFLNLSPDHLDRHFTIENYFSEKAKLFKNMKQNDYILLNYDDERVKELESQVKSKVYFFSTKKELKKGIFVRDKKIILANDNKEETVLELSDINLLGEHNLSNILCASLACYLYKINISFIKEGIKTFVPAPHRLSFVAQKKGVSYYNDSKATNIDACKKALSSFKQKIVLMLGGSDKGENYDELFKILPKNVRAVVVSGDNKNKILSSAKNYSFKKIFEAKNFEDSFKIASSVAKAGEVVLLAPASASFDEFVNYADRGETFIKLVGELYDKTA